MRKLSALAIIGVMVACQSSSNDLESKQKLLAEKEKQVAELQEDIRTLKKEVAELDTTNEEVAATPVRAITVKPGRFEHFVELTGTVTSKENILISAEAGGRIESIPVEEGDAVKRGQVMVRIDKEAISNQLEEAKSVYELAETTYDKRKKLWDQSIGSEIEYLQAKNSYETARSRLAQIRTRYQNTIIKSPIKGNVDNLFVNEGEFVNIGAPVVRVVDVENVEIEAELSEEYLPNVKKGDSVQVSIPALNYRDRAVVDFVSQVINPENRSFTVKVRLPNEDRTIKPNVLANLKISDYHNDSALVVPSGSIGKDLKGDYVFVVNAEGDQMVATKKYIETGKSFGSETEIPKGLDPGDRVITAGSDEVNVGEKVAIQ